MKKLYISQDDYNILNRIFQTLSCQIVVFGSRIKGTQQKFSDLDICLKAKDSMEIIDIAELKETFSDSDVPFIVDIVDYQNLSAGFKKIIDTQGINFYDTQPVLG